MQLNSFVFYCSPVTFWNIWSHVFLTYMLGSGLLNWRDNQQAVLKDLIGFFFHKVPKVG